jgi:hypothetical protein
MNINFYSFLFLLYIKNYYSKGPFYTPYFTHILYIVLIIL